MSDINISGKVENWKNVRFFEFLNCNGMYNFDIEIEKKLGCVNVFYWFVYGIDVSELLIIFI